MLDNPSAAALVALFFAVVVFCGVLHVRLNKSFKVEWAWVAIAITPTIIWLIASGRLSEFTGFGIGLTLRAASEREFSLATEGNAIETEQIASDLKEGLSKIEVMIRERRQALVFELGKTGYYTNEACKEYLRRLTEHDFFRYVVFRRADGTFAGLVPARDFYRQIGKGLDPVAVIESGRLDSVAGVITDSVKEGATKQEALQKIERLHVPELPVVNDKGSFAGVVSRDRLLGSIVLELVTSKK